MEISFIHTGDVDPDHLRFNLGTVQWMVFQGPVEFNLE